MLHLRLRLHGRRFYATSTTTATFQICHQPERKTENELISLIKSISQKSHLLQIHAHLLRSDDLQNPRIFLQFLSRISLPPLQNLLYGRKIFHLCGSPDVSIYEVMIRAHSKNISSSSLGFELYREMLRFGLPSDEFCSLSAVKCCVKKKCMFSGGLQVHCRVLKDGFRSDAVLLTTLMDFYSVNGKGYEACKVFDEIPERDTAAWNVLLSCFIQNKRMKDALSAFEVMEKSNGFRPDDVSCLLVLDACAKLSALKFGERVHGYVKEWGMENFVKIQNSLVNMYSRCGSVEKAYEVFLGISDKNVVTWSAMISGLASNGHGRDAIEAFKAMRRANVPPDDQTCTAVLSGCSRSGLVQEGRMFFDLMEEELGIVPNLYHYGCMVDMLGRAGFLDDAYELIRSMKIKPDAAIWRTLLVACRNHRNADLGGRVVEHLIEMRAEKAGDYVLLVNLYSSLNNSEKAEEVQKCMKEKGIQMNPGSSSIEFGGEVHQFVADDESHPRTKEIYTTLDEINQQLRIAGYVAEITSELYHTGKCTARLSYHSEKLAIAFGILVTPPGKKICVAKDRRICPDCHSFAKLVSGVYNRKVVIRDGNRFHHFREGRCSCDDYW